MLSKDQRDKLRKIEEATPGTRAFARAKKEAIKREQIERCYRQYSPPQIAAANSEDGRMAALYLQAAVRN